jgi:hypothetical protein
VQEASGPALNSGQEVQPLWANSEKLIVLMDDASRTRALADLAAANRSPLGAFRVSVADRLRKYFEPAATHCASPGDVHEVRPGQLFLYVGKEMHCKGFHYPTTEIDRQTTARIRIGANKDPLQSEGEARLSHSLVGSVDSLSPTGYTKYLLAARFDGNKFVPLVAGLVVLSMSWGEERSSSDGYQRVLHGEPVEFADHAIGSFRREVEVGHAWKLVASSNSDHHSREHDFQNLFEVVCNVASNDFDVSVDPQSDHGAGTVDLCITKGAADPCCVELKLSRNPNLVHGLEVQLPAYMESKGATVGRYVVLCTDDGPTPDLVESKLAGVAARNGQTIEHVVVDGRSRKSASVR